MLSDRLVAHRGFQKYYPENTLLAFDKALQAGARFIETDIHFTADFQPVLYHDLSMKRISGIENLISSLPFNEVITLPAYEPVRLGPTFQKETITPLSALIDWIMAHPQLTVFVEVKPSTIAFAGIEKAFSILSQQLAPIIKNVVLISFDKDFIAYAQSQEFSPLGLVATKWSDLVTTDLNLDYFFCNHDKIPENIDLNLASSKLVIYEVADWKLAAGLFKRGVDMVETFDFGGLLHDLGRHSI